MTKLEEKFAMAVMFGELQDVANGQLTGQDCSKLVKWFDAAITAERERIIAELQDIEQGGDEWRRYDEALREAIKIVKGGDER